MSYARRFLISMLLLALIVTASLSAMHQSDMRYYGSGEVIPIGSRLYVLFDDLFLLCGHTSPSTSRPWTVAEARNELSKIDDSRLSGISLDLFRQISAVIAEDERCSVFVDISLNPEVYMHINDTFCLEEDWEYGYTKRNPLACLGLNAIHGGFSIHLELSYGQGRVGDNDTLSTIEDYVVNIKGKTYHGAGDAEDEYGYQGDFRNLKVVSRSSVYGSGFTFNGLGPSDLETPRVANITYTWDGFSIGAYRGQKTWGRSRIGNFIFDSHIDRYQYVSAKVFNQKFSLDFTVMFPEPYLGESNDVSDYGPVRRFFLAHRLDYQFRNNMKISLSENVMYRAVHYADFQYMNPSTVFHNNLNSGQFNEIAHIEFEYAPFAGFQIYSQLAIDQGSVPFFEDSSTEDLAAGLTIGTEYAFTTTTGIIDLNFEAVYATPALYRREAPDFIITTSSRMPESYLSVPLFTLMGFKYGGDTMAFRLDADYRSGGVCIFANQSIILKGGFSVYDEYIPGMFSDEFLSDDISLISISNVGMEYSFNIREKLSAVAFVDTCIIHNEKGTDLQIACGVKTSYTTL